MRHSRIKKILGNPWTVGIGVAIFGTLFTAIVDVLKEKRIFSTLRSIVVQVWKFIRSALLFDLKVWWVLIGICVVILGLWLYSKILDMKSTEPSKPPFLSYIQDDILGYRFKWVWKQNSLGEYYADNLQPICIKCGTPLVREYGGYAHFKCLRCDERYKKTCPTERDVMILIRDNAERICKGEKLE